MKTPKVILENDVFQKIMFWVNQSDYEVSGLGMLRVEPDGILRVVDAMLLPQKNGHTHTDIEADDVGKLLYAMRKTPGDLRFWWHSHVNMGVFWSATDMKTIEELGQAGWFLSTVFNKKREMKSAFYAGQGAALPWGNDGLFLDDLETTVESYSHPMSAEWAKEYDEKVTNAVIPSVSYLDNRSVWPGMGWGDDYDSVSYPKERPPAEKPPGMSKKAWKKLQKTQDKIEDETWVDAYGFTREERAFLAGEGFDSHEIDELVDYDFTPIEILRVAQYGCLPEEITAMLETGWTPGDIVKHMGSYNETTPVADRRRG